MALQVSFVPAPNHMAAELAPLKQSSPSYQIRRWDSATRKAEHTDSKLGTNFHKPHIIFHRHARGRKRASRSFESVVPGIVKREPIRVTTVSQWFNANLGNV